MKTKFSLLLALLFTCYLKAQVVPNIDWQRYYNGITTPSLASIANALDAFSNAYVTGYVTVGTNKNLIVLKYDSTGTLLWQANYDNGFDDIGNAICYDPLGNVYVTGVSYGSPGSQNDYVTIKYDTAGSQQWVRRFNATNGNDEAKDIKVDASGNVYVTGTCYNGTGPKSDIGTVKYASNGNLLWATYYDGNSFDDAGVALTLSSNGNAVFIAGNKGIGTSLTDIVVQSLNSNVGSVNWTYTVSGTGTGNDNVKSMILSGANVVLCGQVNNTSTGVDYTTIKLNGSSGSQIFKSNYDFSSALNYATDLVKDSTGNIVVVGKALNGSVYEYHTVFYDSTGAQQWVNKESTLSGSGFVEPKIACDTIAHHFYCVGERVNNTSDIFVYQVTPGGNTSWKKCIDGPAYNFDCGFNLAVNGIGEVYVSALTTNSLSGYDITTIKIGQTPIYFPPDLIPNQRPNVGYLFIENKGQILSEGTNSVATEVIFACADNYPGIFFGTNKFSYKFFNYDTLKPGGSDTVQRIDINHYRSNPLVEAYPASPMHGLNSYMQEGLPDAVVGAQGYERYFIPNIYPYIDLHYYSNENGLQMYYVVKPGADPSRIVWEINGASSHAIVSNSLNVNGFNGHIKFARPSIYTVNMLGAAQSITATASWSNIATDRYKFAISGALNPALPHIISVAYGNGTTAIATSTDNLWFCTYYGNFANEGIKAIDTDPVNGNYVALFEVMTLKDRPAFPTNSGSLISVSNSTNSLGVILGIVLFNKDGKRLAANTYGSLGLPMNPQSVVLNGRKVTVIGNNKKRDLFDGNEPDKYDPLPLYNSVASLSPGTFTSDYGHGYVVQFEYTILGGTPCINQIKWATRLAGYSSDIAKTPDGKNLYITCATNLQTGANTQTVAGAYNHSSFYFSRYTFRVAKFDTTGVRSWATIFRADNNNYLRSNSFNSLNSQIPAFMAEDPYVKCKIACDKYGFSLAGETDTVDLKIYSKYGAPTYSVHSGRTDGFFARFNRKDDLVYSSYVGGQGDDAFSDVTAINGLETAMVGYSDSRNYQRICTNPGLYSFSDTTTTGSVRKMLIAKYDTSGYKTWSTFIGSHSASTKALYGWGITSGSDGQIFATGRNYQATAGYQQYITNPPGLYSEFNLYVNESYVYGFNALNSLAWNTTFGGTNNDMGMAMASNTINNTILLAGVTRSKGLGWPAGSPPFPARSSGIGGGVYEQDQLASQGPNGFDLSLYDGFIACFQTQNVVGINEYFNDKKAESAFELFPNPTANYSNIAFKEEMRGAVKIEVYNQMGQLLSTENKRDIQAKSLVEINTSAYPAGCYLVTITNNGLRQTKKLILSK